MKTESQPESKTLPTPPIDDVCVLRLIEGIDVETLAIYDVSDVQLYGRKHARQLTGELGAAAEQAGCEPTVYQAVLWWCLVYVPIVPRGCYFILPCVECDDPDGDAEQYRGIRVTLDAEQIRHHRVVTVTLVAIFVLAALWWCLP